jgi:hypothetical protein
MVAAITVVVADAAVITIAAIPLPVVTIAIAPLPVIAPLVTDVAVTVNGFIAVVAAIFLGTGGRGRAESGGQKSGRSEHALDFHDANPSARYSGVIKHYASARASILNRLVRTGPCWRGWRADGSSGGGL